MPITLKSAGSRCRVKAVKGNDAVKKHLASMGFVEGAEVTVISEAAGSYILGICDSRVAVDRGLAMRILV